MVGGITQNSMGKKGESAQPGITLSSWVRLPALPGLHLIGVSGVDGAYARGDGEKLIVRNFGFGRGCLIKPFCIRYCVGPGAEFTREMVFLSCETWRDPPVVTDE